MSNNYNLGPFFSNDALTSFIFSGLFIDFQAAIPSGTPQDLGVGWVLSWYSVFPASFGFYGLLAVIFLSDIRDRFLSCGGGRRRIPPEFYFHHGQRDKLHLTVMYENGWMRMCIEMFCLNEEESWTNVETYMVMSSYLISHLKPLHLMRNKNWLMIHDHDYYRYKECSLYIVNFDEKTNRSRRDDGTLLVNKGVIPQAVRYIETLVSPNQYMNEPKFHYKTKKRYNQTFYTVKIFTYI
ncbi:uncharacterized protein [Rutidosis leptorrhynchoides]|uniref:uncharacterized protein n=1 Tax=Rutidosis leptorrhynchoides TaxID=125765 RepID=UPI003A99720A